MSYSLSSTVQNSELPQKASWSQFQAKKRQFFAVWCTDGHFPPRIFAWEQKGDWTNKWRYSLWLIVSSKPPQVEAEKTQVGGIVSACTVLTLRDVSVYGRSCCQKHPARRSRSRAVQFKGKSHR